MAGEDRDRLFEKALAHHLRADGVAARALACLDAEVLAAYQERQLSPEQMSAAQEHVASCLRCQEIVARLNSVERLSQGPTFLGTNYFWPTESFRLITAV